MMKKKQWVLLIIALAVLCGGVFLINRDILHWEVVFGYKAELNPDEFAVDYYYYLGTDDLTLKPGSYTLTISGNLGTESGPRSAVKVFDAEGDVLLLSYFTGGEENNFRLDIEGKVRRIRIYILYAPASGEISVDKVKISSDGILYKGSVLRHLAVTAFFFLLWMFLAFRFVFPEQYRKCFPKISKPETEVSILLLILLTVLCCIPLFSFDSYYEGDDIYYHLLSISGISDSLAKGYIPARILLGFVENYGYGAGFYYPNLFLHLPAALMLLGFSNYFAYKIFVFLCTFFSLTSIYSCTKKISGKLSAARVSAVLYAFAAYRLVDVYYRAALGEIQAFVFMPIIILGLYEIYEGHPEKWYYFALGFMGLLMCHVISLAICGVFTLAFVLIKCRKTFGDCRIFLALLKSVLITLALGAYFILPMFEQMATVVLNINIVISGENQLFPQLESFSRLFLFFKPWIFENQSHSVYPGWVLLVVPVLRLIFVRKRTREVVIADTLSLFGAAALIMCTDAFPWHCMMGPLYRIQFSWRIMMIATVCLCVSCAVYADSISSSKWSIIAVAVGAAACGLPIMIDTCANRMRPTYQYDYYQSKVNVLSGAEYLPADFKTQYIKIENKDDVVSSAADCEITDYKRRGLTFTFSYEVKDAGEDVYFSVPLIMYTGYRAELTAVDGTVTELRPEADDIGLVRVYTGGVDSGTIYVHYEKTTIQIVSEIISLTTVAFVIVLKLYKKKESRL